MKPILFNSDMARGILEGRKTVTRRVIKPQPQSTENLVSRDLLPETTEAGAGPVYAWSGGTVTTPPYQPGDILYVRETWGDYATENDPGAGYYMYRADYPPGAITTTHPDGTVFELPRWKPSIHMPREAARIFLRVKDVRVERLHNITAQGCLDEGVKLSLYGIWDGESTTAPFAHVWDSTIKPADRAMYGWAANPWVWVIQFERISKEET